MRLIATDQERRLRQRREWWLRATMSDDPVVVEEENGSELEGPPVPANLFGGRDDEESATAGCFDFSPPNNTGIVQVNVYRATVSGGPYTLVGNFNPVTDTQLFDGGLIPGQDYFYVLRSLGDGITYLAEESGNSAEIDASA